MSKVPKSIHSLLKTTLCPKRKFPYGNNEDLTFYDPGCVENMYTCKDYCGKKCQKICKENNHDGVCQRGQLSDQFLFCPTREKSSQTTEMPYVSYKLVSDTTVKEGKSAYKKMEQVTEDKDFDSFLETYKSNFPLHAKHQTEAWLLNTIKNTCCDGDYQPNSLIHIVSDFAQNLKLDLKKETSEEYFHKPQIAIFASVASVNVKVSDDENRQHTVSQITSSDCK